MIRLDNSNRLCTEIDIVTLCDHAYVILLFFDLSCCCLFDVLEYYVLEGCTGGGLCHSSRAEKLMNHGYLNFTLKLFTCHANYVCHGSRRIFF